MHAWDIQLFPTVDRTTSLYCVIYNVHVSFLEEVGAKSSFNL